MEASRQSRFQPVQTYSRLVSPAIHNLREDPIMPAPPTSPAREAIRGIVPKLAEVSDQVIYGDVWERPGLSKRDRSLIVVATLLALGRERQLEGHLARALANGVTKEEIGEVITHLAFYAGWPAAMTAALVAKDVFAKG
jgi:4-carboxymuconolactone decarboxylase